jgi:hypothetical protein
MLAALLLAWQGTSHQPGPVRWEARWSCRPEAVELGQPFELVLDLYHGQEARAGELFSGQPSWDDSWAPLSGPAVRGLALEHEPETRLTELSWTLVSLEPGERDLGSLLAGITFDQRIGMISLAGARVSVRGVLGEGEDLPRPLREFPEGFAGEGTDAAGSAWPLAALAGGLIALTLALALVLRALRARRRQAPAEPTPVERLERIEGLLDGSGEPARAAWYELTRLLRESLGTATAGLTDEEWLGAMRASGAVPAAVLDDLAAVLERCAAAKYAGEEPSPWMRRETCSRARLVLQAVGAGGAP